jgi:predicted enzyme related to lactoylglutathione lyase
MVKNSLCHFEFMTSDPEKTKDFYGKVFNWTFQSWEGPVKYELIKTGAAPEGGLMEKPEQAPHPALNVYFLVDDVEATLETAKQAGGTVIVPKMEIPAVGFRGMFMDPDGIPVGVFEESKQ